jgi:hypothetical protein
MHSLLADFILVIHFAFVLFVVGGLVLIWAGGPLQWCWVRHFRFRIAHLVAILFVVAEAIAGTMCPLTVWEDALRGQTTSSGFIERWIHRVMFYTLPDWVFTLIYVIFALVVAATFWLVPLSPRKGKQKG